MVKINENYLNLPSSYLFSEIARRTREYQASNPGVKLLRLGIGNTTEPIPPAVIAGLHDGVDSLASAESYSGYGDEQGNSTLRRRIAEVKYQARGIDVEPDEVFIGDGAKPDTANIQSIFSSDAVVAVQDPAYPVYVDTNVIAGRSGQLRPDGTYDRFVYMPCTEENGFFPSIPSNKADLIYLCNPNNPTGVVATEAQLRKFVDYALANDAVILYDAAYECFIREDGLPHSIYVIEGAKRCAIELNTFSKEAGFTGVRLGWTVVPKQMAVDDHNKRSLHEIWNRRTTTFFNGASNIAQAGALAALSPDGREQNDRIIQFYMENAKIIRNAVGYVGLTVFGGINAPYIWVKTPAGLTSWEFFDKLLQEAQVVSTPGAGFGPSGEGFMRLSAFGHRPNIEEAVASIRHNLKL